jgi:hypothetical protein
VGPEAGQMTVEINAFIMRELGMTPLPDV